MKTLVTQFTASLVLIGCVMSYSVIAEERPEKVTDVETGLDLLDKYFLRPESIFTSDLTKAHEIMSQLMSMGHTASIIDFGPTLEKCISAGPINVKEVLAQYGKLEEYTTAEWYDFPIMQLAEEASRGEITGQPNNLLALQLVCRSDDRSPGDLQIAVAFLAENLDNGPESKQFVFCEHVFSSAMANLCTFRGTVRRETLLDQTLEKLKSKITPKQQILIEKAYRTGLAFIEEKAGIEERHSGSFQSSQIMNSALAQKEELLEFYTRVVNRETTEKPVDYAEKKKLMEQTLDQIFGLFEKFQFGGGAIITANDVSTVQNLWEKHAKTTAEFASSVDQSLSQIDYETIFISTRLEQLITLLKSLQWDVENEYAYPK